MKGTEPEDRNGINSGGSRPPRFEHAQSPYTIELLPDVLSEIMTAVETASAQGIEIGGLLTGSFPRSATLTLRIESFIPFKRRAGDGVNFDLPAEQRARLSKVRHDLIRQQRPVVGFVRSHLRKDKLELSTSDRDLLATEFRKAVHIALLMRAEAPHTAALFVPGADGNLSAGPPLPGFQFAADSFARPSRAAPAGPEMVRHPESAVPVSPAIEQVREPTQAETVARAQVRKLAAAAILVLCLALALTAGGGSVARTLTRRSALELKVVRNANVLEIAWNPLQKELEQGRPATLLINDGVQQRTVRLSPSEVRLGRVSYEYTGGPVELSLKVGLADSTELVQTVVWPGR